MSVSSIDSGSRGSVDPAVEATQVSAYGTYAGLLLTRTFGGLGRSCLSPVMRHFALSDWRGRDEENACFTSKARDRKTGPHGGKKTLFLPGKPINQVRCMPDWLDWPNFRPIFVVLTDSLTHRGMVRNLRVESAIREHPQPRCYEVHTVGKGGAVGIECSAPGAKERIGEPTGENRSSGPDMWPVRAAAGAAFGGWQRRCHRRRCSAVRAMLLPQSSSRSCCQSASGRLVDTVLSGSFGRHLRPE